jgi:hypothetical protein
VAKQGGVIVVKGKLRSAISGIDPVKGHAADREICRGEAVGAESLQKVEIFAQTLKPTA